MAAKLKRFVIENQRRLVVLALAVMVFALFGFTPSIRAQVSRSSTFCTKVGNADPAANPCKQAINPANFVFYCQADPQWQDECDIWYAGCGPTSLAMVASTLGLPTTPVEMDQAFRDNGARICGTSPASNDPSYLPTFFASGWLENHGLDGSNRVAHGPNNTIDLVDAKRMLDLGYLLVTSSLGETYPCDGDGWCRNPNASIDHVFVIDQVDIANNTFEVRDPANCTQANPAEGPHNIRTNNFAVQTIYAVTTRQK